MRGEETGTIPRTATGGGGWARRALGLPARRPVATLGVAAVLLVICVAGVLRTRPDASLGRMFPRDDAAAQSLVRVLDRFAAVEELLVLVTVPEGERTEPPEIGRLLGYARRLEEGIRGSAGAAELTDGVLWRADEEMRGFVEKVLGPNALFYLDEAGFEAAKRRLTREEMAKQVRQNEALVSAPGPAAEALANAFIQDPLRLHEFAAERLGALRPFKTYGNSDAFLSPDGQSLLVRVRGKRPPSDLDFAKRITDVVGDLARRANSDGLVVELTGAYAIAATSAGAIRGDMIASVITSVVLLQLLFAVVYRRGVRLFVLAFGPVALGVVYGFGVHGWVEPTISPLTAVVGGILAGMGIDYSLHYLSHYLSLRDKGTDAEGAATETTMGLAGPLAVAAATSMIGFAAIALSSVSALRDFAFVGALGLGGALAATVVLLPAILVLVAGRSGERATGDAGIRVGIEPVLRGIVRRRRTVAMACGAMFAGAAVVIAMPGEVLPLEPDLRVMHPSPNAALDAHAHLAERMGIAADSLLVHLRAESPEELQQLAHRAEERLRRPAVREAGVAGTLGLAALLPDPAVVADRVRETGPAVADRVVSDFTAAVEESIFAQEAFEPYRTFLRHLLTRDRAPEVGDLLRYRGLAETILPASAVDGTEPATEAVTYVFVSRPLSERATREGVIEATRASLADLPGATLTGMSVVGHDTERAVHRDLPKLVWLSVGLVAVYLLVYFRSASAAVLAVMPTVFSLACVLACMRLTGQKLNMINLVSLPLLIGINVDYGVYLVSLARRHLGVQTAGRFVAGIAPSSHAIVMCAVTTVLGFGSLVTTSVPAVRSLGFVVGVGVLACVVGTFGVLVPVLARGVRRGEA